MIATKKPLIRGKNCWQEFQIDENIKKRFEKGKEKEKENHHPLIHSIKSKAILLQLYHLLEESQISKNIASSVSTDA